MWRTMTWSNPGYAPRPHPFHRKICIAILPSHHFHWLSSSVHCPLAGGKKDPGKSCLSTAPRLSAPVRSLSRPKTPSTIRSTTADLPNVLLFSWLFSFLFVLLFCQYLVFLYILLLYYYFFFSQSQLNHRDITMLWASITNLGIDFLNTGLPPIFFYLLRNYSFLFSQIALISFLNLLFFLYSYFFHKKFPEVLLSFPDW